MTVIDPGHMYQLHVFDGEATQIIWFMKREGPSYPGNVGHHEGTNIQDVIRVLIHRTQYLDNQIQCQENQSVISALRSALIDLETRAAHRHGLHPKDISGMDVENVPFCTICGHWICKH